MNRQFQAKISIKHYALLAVLLSVAIYFVWHTEMFSYQGCGILMAAVLLLMVIVIERMIHTTYTITSSNTLIIRQGRFSKEKAIQLDDIDRIDQIKRYRIGNKPLHTYLAIVLKNNIEYYITPRNEEDFIKCIIQKKKKKETDE